MATVQKGSKKLITSFSEFKGVLTWNFANGEVLEFNVLDVAFQPNPDGVRMLVDEVVSDVGMKALLHGFKQRISDAGAMSCDQVTGASPTPEARIARMRRVAERLSSGEWELERKGGTGGGESVLARALSEVFSKPLDVIRPWLKDKSPAEREALKSDEKVAKVILRLTTEAAKGTDVSGLMGELEGLGNNSPETAKLR